MRGEGIRELTGKDKRDSVINYLRDSGIKWKFLTCDNCPSKNTCEWAYDGYNTDGDCLAEK